MVMITAHVAAISFTDIYFDLLDQSTPCTLTSKTMLSIDHLVMVIMYIENDFKNIYR